METTQMTKSERINLRLESNAKRLLERAASFEGQSVSHFILTSALERAKKAVQEHERLALNAKQSRTLFEAITSPIDFNDKLTNALEEHSNRVVSK